MATVAQYLFEPCSLYHLDPHPGLRLRLRWWLRGKPAPSCVTCERQYRPGVVCGEFRERLLLLADRERLMPCGR